jgi:ribonuclease HI
VSIPPYIPNTCTDESFSTLAEAEQFMKTGRSSKAKPPKQEFFYAVHTDRIDSVFTDWPSAAAAMKGHKGIKQQKFKTAEEAWAHLDRIKAGTPSDASAPLSVKSETLKGATKKLKKNDGSAAVAQTTISGDYYEPGTGPLPPGAQDGFDDTIFLNPDTGKVEHKTDAQKNARKKQPTGEISGPIEIYTDGSSLGNGKVGAVAGLGVWFGHDDPR